MKIRQIHIALLLVMCMSVWAEQTGELVVSTHNQRGGMVFVTSHNDRTYYFKAVANPGFTFQGWLDGESSPEREYTHTEGLTNPDKVLSAIFTKDEDMTQEDGHTELIVENGQIKLEAVANNSTDAPFYVWNNGSNTNPILYIEGKDGMRIPFYQITTPRLKVVAQDKTAGEVQKTEIGDRMYSFLAVAHEGYTFWGWSDGTPATTNPREYTHSSTETTDKVFHAVFTRNEDFNVTNGHLTITNVTDNASMPLFTLTPVADGNASFKMWSNGSEANPLTGYKESDGTRHPFFVSDKSQLRVTTIEHIGGIVTPTLVEGRRYSFLAEAKDGYTFKGWTDGKDASNNPREYTHSDADATPDAIFHAIFTKDADVTRPGGTVTVSVNSATTPSFDLKANPDETCVGGTKVHLWSNGTSGDKITGYIEDDGTCIPYFTRGNSAVGYEKEDGVGGTILVSQLECGFHLQAVANDGYAFVGWKDNASLPAERDVDYAAATFKADFSQANFKVGDNYYVTLDEAAATGQPVEMIGDANSVVVSTTVTLNANGHTITDLTILNGGTLTLAANLTVTNLYLNATTGTSSQLFGDDKLTYTNAYMDLTLVRGQTEVNPDLWYAFAVPFQVDIESGIARASGSGNHVSGVDYLIWKYDGQLRADTRNNGWVKMMGGTLEPGKFYMIGVDGEEGIWRFTKNSGTPLNGGNTVEMFEFGDGGVGHSGWNGVANPSLHYADAEVESEIFIAQVYINGEESPRYEVKNLLESSFVMASPMFIQTAGNDQLLLSESATQGRPLYAPTRTEEYAKYYRVNLLNVNNEEEDVVFITTSEDAINDYEIGKDVAKMIGGNGNPYLWLDAYGYQLCAQYAPIVGGETYCTLGIYSPKAASYTLDLNRNALPEDVDVMVTNNGQVVWNLSDGPLPIEVAKGETYEYGILINGSHRVPTGLGTEKMDRNVWKYIQQQRLFIRVNGSTYDIMGGQVNK